MRYFERAGRVVALRGGAVGSVAIESPLLVVAIDPTRSEKSPRRLAGRYQRAEITMITNLKVIGADGALIERRRQSGGKASRPEAEATPRNAARRDNASAFMIAPPSARRPL